MTFQEWFYLNREKLAALAARWFLSKKERDLIKTITNTFDHYFAMDLSIQSLAEDDRPPILPLIIIGPDGNPVPVPPKPKPPVKKD